MARFTRFFCTIGRAIARNGGRALASLAPFGEFAYDVAKETLAEYRDETPSAPNVPLPPAQPTPSPPAPEIALELIPSKSPDPASVPVEKYTLGDLLAKGDVADCHLANEFIVKIARTPGVRFFLENERQMLKRLHAQAEGTAYRRYLPELVESITVRQDFPKRANVFRLIPGLFTLEQVRARHSSLDVRHLGWIFNRLLTVLGFCHRVGVVHGAVLPCHVLLQPQDHGLILVGWGQSALIGEVMTTVPARYLDWYPPETRNKQPAVPATDVYLAARCALYLAGVEPNSGPGPLPKELWNFFKSCLLPGVNMRPGDAWSLYDDYNALLRRLYGPPCFLPLEM